MSGSLNSGGKHANGGPIDAHVQEPISGGPRGRMNPKNRTTISRTAKPKPRARR